jgi:hypothetical protein
MLQDESTATKSRNRDSRLSYLPELQMFLRIAVVFRLLTAGCGSCTCAKTQKVKLLERAIFVGNVCRQSNRSRVMVNGEDVRLQPTVTAKLPFLGMECACTVPLDIVPLPCLTSTADGASLGRSLEPRRLLNAARRFKSSTRE